MSGWDNRNRQRLTRPLVWVLAIVVSLPIQWKGLAGLYVWLSPFVAFDVAIAQRSVEVMHLIALVVLLLCVWRRRWFCRHICFVGWTCQQVARLGRKERRIHHAEAGRYVVVFALGMALTGIPLIAAFDPLILFRSFLSAVFLPLSVATVVWGGLFILILLSNMVWKQAWCQSLCPLGGFQEMAHNVRTNPQSIMSRRTWLTGLAGIGGGWLIHNQAKPQRSTLLPPSALKDGTLYTSCLRCGNCVNACPAHIIQLNRTPKTLWEWQTPVVDLSDGYCWSDCNACGQACPSGALRPFSLQEKKYCRMGRAKLNAAHCLLSRFKECDRCYAVCAFDAIQIKNTGLSSFIVIDEKNCVGCGACMQICPQNAISIHP